VEIEDKPDFWVEFHKGMKNAKDFFERGLGIQRAFFMIIVVFCDLIFSDGRS